MLLFVIFGWPVKVKDKGAAYPQYCDHCQNQVFFHLVKTRRWFSLFFVPLLPLWKASWYFTCEVCEASVDLTKDEAKALKPLVGETEKVANGEIDQEEYEQLLFDIEDEVWGSSERGEDRNGEIPDRVKEKEPVEMAVASVSKEADETVSISNDVLEDHLRNVESGTMITKREVEQLAPSDDAEGWWDDTAQPALEDSQAVEQADSTGLRWRVR